MNRSFYLLFFSLLSLVLQAHEKAPWSKDYHSMLLDKLGHKIVALSTYPEIEYPNRNSDEILNKYPDQKVLVFGYGSLINVTSAARSVNSTAIQSMRPVVAFGLKRIFNYKAGNVSQWGTDLSPNERAMLNLEPTTTYNHVINGIVMKVDSNDLSQLVRRETGYDLVPILVADWNEAVAENAAIEIEIAYTFFVPDELREGIDYTQTSYYPVRGYLHAIREGAIAFGHQFLDFWNWTTYLSDGTTTVAEWDEQIFSGILDTKEP